MPELSRFYGIIITMYYNDSVQHHKPHVHASYGEYEDSIALDGELIAGRMPAKQYRIISGWMAIHEEELYEAFSRCLSSFEIKVLDLYLEGLSYREIADRLCRNAKSIDNAVQRIRQKLAREHLFGDISRC